MADDLFMLEDEVPNAPAGIKTLKDMISHHPEHVRKCLSIGLRMNDEAVAFLVQRLEEEREVTRSLRPYRTMGIFPSGSAAEDAINIACKEQEDSFEI